METVSVVVSESSQVAEARRAAVDLCRKTPASQEDTGRAALIATEVATNLVKHTPEGGQILLNLIERAGGARIEIISIDCGKGMPEIAKCMQDGFSKSGSAGQGLGAIQRVADFFQVYTITAEMLPSPPNAVGSGGVPRPGTVLVARVQLVPEGGWAVSLPLRVGGVGVALPDEERNGDAWGYVAVNDSLAICIVDGLGHGDQAAEAAAEAMTAFREGYRDGPAGVLDYANNALRGTRGAAMAVAQIDPADSCLRYAAVGNISTIIIHEAGNRHALISQHGIVGSEKHRVREVRYPWAAGDVTVLHSDGVSTHWRLEDYPGLIGREPSIIASVLLRDYRRIRDDATVAVASPR